MSNNAFSRLLKVLSLERKQGYRNKAVIGGLDKFASRWEADALAEARNPGAVSEIVSLMLGYSAIGDVTARERILDQIVRRARDATSSDALTAGKAPPPAEAPTGAAPTGAAPTGTTPTGATPTGTTPTGTTPTGTTVAEARPAPLPPTSRPAPEELPAEEITLPPFSKPAPAASEVSTPPEFAPTRPMPALSKPETEPRTPAPGQAPLSTGRAVAPGRPTIPKDAEPQKLAKPGIGGLDAPVTRLPNIGVSFAQKLTRLGVNTVRDLFYLLPRRYDNFSLLRTIDKLRYGEEVTVIGTVWELKSRTIGDKRRMIIAVVGDGTSEMEMTWFNPYVERRLRGGRAYSFSGKVDSYRGRLLMRNPEFEPLEKSQVHTGRLVPIYPLTQGITARWLRLVIRKAVDAWAVNLGDFLPEGVRRENRLLPLSEALEQIHFPVNEERLHAAHRRLSFDEFFILQLGVLGHRKQFRDRPARALRADDAVFAPFLATLPFAMTAAQRRVLGDIATDLGRAQPMSRLLQGDVGSGKTAVAAAALWAAVANGAQGAIMAPTEILAEQHARSFGAMFADLPHPLTGRPVQVTLLTGAMRRADRDAALAALAAGEIDIAVGTHALIQEDVTFRELTVAVVDEQHRFGVEQRAALRQKGLQPHVLVMSATPIPRSLALTIYGDLDISVIDEMPAGRTPVKTKWLTPDQRERVYSFIRQQAASGRQAFIVYPLVEETENSEGNAAVEEHARLQNELFPDLRLGLLHGRMKGEEKDAVMRAFRGGELDVLVATSVVEVGIDVPNATVILIEGAERFGLAQLHQFRGRVGRGQHPSYCVLISAATEGEGLKRLRALEQSNDGFALAQIDLELRGPGDFFGTRQSGIPALRTAELSDLRTLEAARSSAQRLFERDPQLELPEHQALAAQVAAFWASAMDASQAPLSRMETEWQMTT